MDNRFPERLSILMSRPDRIQAKRNQGPITDCGIALGRICASALRLEVPRGSCLLGLLILFFEGCAVMLVGPYDEVTNQAITDLANRMEEFLTRMEATGIL